MKKGGLEMSETTLKKTAMTFPETPQTAVAFTGKKNWKRPELTEVDYDKTNTGFTGSGTDLSFYS